MSIQNNYVAIMAGGIGSRFWPMSRTALPKQFLDILGTGRSDPCWAPYLLAFGGDEAVATA